MLRIVGFVHDLAAREPLSAANFYNGCTSGTRLVLKLLILVYIRADNFGRTWEAKTVVRRDAQDLAGGKRGGVDAALGQPSFFKLKVTTSRKVLRYNSLRRNEV